MCLCRLTNRVYLLAATLGCCRWATPRARSASASHAAAAAQARALLRVRRPLCVWQTLRLTPVQTTGGWLSQGRQLIFKGKLSCPALLMRGRNRGFSGSERKFPGPAARPAGASLRCAAKLRSDPKNHSSASASAFVLGPGPEFSPLPQTLVDAPRSGASSGSGQALV